MTQEQSDDTQTAEKPVQEELSAEELDLNDEQVIEILKNHGFDRRTLMKVAGAGALVSAFGGTASASSHIDAQYGETVAASETTSIVADHTVELHVVQGGVHEDFPVLPGTILLSPRFINHPLGKDTGKETELPYEFYFNPVGLHVSPGDIVKFDVKAHLHTVTSSHPKFHAPYRVPTGPFTSPPIVGDPRPGKPDDAWFYEFNAEGVYDLFCLPHLPLGMVMRIVVTDNPETFSEDPYGTFSMMGEPVPNASDVFDAPEMDPQNIAEKGSIDWAELTL